MLRKILIVLMSCCLCWTTIACGSSVPTQSTETFNNNTNVATTPTPSVIADGKYPVQQATYDDVNGSYSLMLLNTPAGSPPLLQTDKLQMARLSDEAISNGEKTYLQVDNAQPVLYLTEDFKIEYVHNVTQTQTNPSTGQQETVVIRRESNFWTPFAGALAGQALGSLLFRPQYYVPPVYQPGGVLTGYGGYGRSYSQAINNYQERYKTPPAAVKNSQTLRTTGTIRNSSTSSKFNKPTNSGSRATGSGVGSSTLRSSGSSKSKYKSRSSFGSSGFGSKSRSFGGSRRRR
jgi:hypothetical protein